MRRKESDGEDGLGMRFVDADPGLGRRIEAGLLGLSV